MKTKLTFFSLLSLLLIIGCKNNQNDYLRKVLNNLENIETATYRQTDEIWHPGDTIASHIRCEFTKEYNNPKDSTIGASYVSVDCNDTTILLFGYDGTSKFWTDDEEKTVIIDDFTTNRFSFRPVSPPFFNYAKSIIQYILTTKDSINVESMDFEDDYYIKLVIHEDEQVEFFGEAYHMPAPPYEQNPTSIYELWISKSNDLPYKIRREMASEATIHICSEVEFNNLSINDLNVFDYFPENYALQKVGEKSDVKSTDNLRNKKAPDWILNDKNEQLVSLSDYKSKVLLINFTGIGCGPCALAIPFLKKLKNDFSAEDLEIVAIETWGNKPHSLQNYADRNSLNYNLLSATDDLIKDYQTRHGVPVFFILDEQRIIRKIFHGYGIEITDKEIVNAIQEITN